MSGIFNEPTNPATSRALHGLRGWFVSLCVRCKNNTFVVHTTSKEHGDGERCAFCVWRLIGSFPWTKKTEKDSPLYVEHPLLFDPKGNAVHGLR